MSKISPFVDDLIESFQCLPGVGPKSARRMVLHLLERDRDAGKALSKTLLKQFNIIFTWRPNGGAAKKNWENMFPKLIFLNF